MHKTDSMTRKTNRIPADERPERHQIFWTTLLVAAACAPFARYLDGQVTAFLALILAIRLVALRWPAALPNRWIRALLAFAGLGNCLAAYHTVTGQDGGSALLATMLVLKLLELDTKRDLRLVLILLGFLSVVQFLFDESFQLTLYLGLIALGLVTLLTELNGGLGAAGLRPALRVSARLALQAIPLTLVLFVLFPRLTAPLWSLGIDSSRGLMGMSDSMEPGNISELVVNGELAFRARFAGRRPDANQLYWRGPVLWKMDGRRWTPDAPPSGWQRPARLIESSDPIEYEVVMEPTKQRWLFALDMPVSEPEGTAISPDHQLLSNQPVTALKRYNARSVLSYRTAEPDERVRALALELPANVTPRMRALVEDWRTQVADGREERADDWTLVQRALAHFNRENFYYTLLPPKLGANPADEFLFETRRGFCEHYASSFALLMRIAGIPSRIVLGYLGGETNDFGGYTIVRQSDAHAWVEVLIEGRGWVRVDPTAAVDPSRIDNRLATELLGAGASVRFDLGEAAALARWMRDLRLLGDTLEATWQNWVLDFSAQDQRRLMDRLGLGAWQEYGLAVLMVLAVSLTLGGILLVLMHERTERDPLERLYARLCRRLAGVGLPRLPHEGPGDYGQRVTAARPDLASTVGGFLALYVPARYGERSTPETLQRLSNLLRDFDPKAQSVQSAFRGKVTASNGG
ncbi:transglutaminase TgpA family protein [Allochromatium humboldtianum]|nr:transglutaminaseTgpA domain-containing protein [Allochromatium humboldtianum]